MALKYFVTRGVNIKNPQEIKYYGRVRQARTITMNEIAERICKESSLTDTDVLGVIKELSQLMVEQMRQGTSLQLGEFGSFRPVIKSDLAATPEDWKSSMIRSVGVAFHPGELLRTKLRSVELQSSGYASTIDISQFADSDDENQQNA